jgi:hypothetical protein
MANDDETQAGEQPVQPQAIDAGGFTTIFAIAVNRQGELITKTTLPVAQVLMLLGKVQASLLKQYVEDKEESRLVKPAEAGHHPAWPVESAANKAR